MIEDHSAKLQERVRRGDPLTGNSQLPTPVSSPEISRSPSPMEIDQGEVSSLEVSSSNDSLSEKKESEQTQNSSDNHDNASAEADNGTGPYFVQAGQSSPNPSDNNYEENTQMSEAMSNSRRTAREEEESRLLQDTPGAGSSDIKGKGRAR